MLNKMGGSIRSVLKATTKRSATDATPSVTKKKRKGVGSTVHPPDESTPDAEEELPEEEEAFEEEEESDEDDDV